jgi:hypothetical protein
MSKGAGVSLALAALWIAFGLVCIGLTLTRGRGPLLRAKLRLGGLILGFTTLGVSCFRPTCYKDTVEDSDQADTDTDTDADSDTDTDADTDR